LGAWAAEAGLLEEVSDRLVLVLIPRLCGFAAREQPAVCVAGVEGPCLDVRCELFIVPAFDELDTRASGRQRHPLVELALVVGQP
jgi:hypothetical protein